MKTYNSVVLPYPTLCTKRTTYQQVSTFCTIVGRKTTRFSTKKKPPVGASTRGSPGPVSLHPHSHARQAPRSYLICTRSTGKLSHSSFFFIRKKTCPSWIATCPLVQYRCSTVFPLLCFLSKMMRSGWQGSLNSGLGGSTQMDADSSLTNMKHMMQARNARMTHQGLNLGSKEPLPIRSPEELF